MKVVVFGENTNDSEAIKELLLGLCPQLGRGDIKVLRDPPTLQRNAHTRTLTTWVDRASQALRAASVTLGDARCILVHTDADQHDDGSFEAKRTQHLRSAGFPQAHSVVPIEAIESWWLLHPRATESVVPSWAGALRRAPGDVDRIADPKSELVRQTRSKQPKRPYRESDSPAIASAIVSGGHLAMKAVGVSASFGRFVEVAKGCCPAQAR